MNAIETLTKVKLEITDYLENYQNYYKHPEKKKNENDNFLRVRLIIKMIAKEAKFEIPSFITNCRTVDEAINELFSDRAETYMQINYVTRLFNEYIDYLEEQELDVKIIKVEAEVPNELKFEHLMDALEKCDNRINGGDYSGAVTSAKTLVEGVCKEILHKFSDTTDYSKTDLPALFSRVRDKLNLDPSDIKLDKALKEVLTGLIKVVSGITEIRNKRGDSHLLLYKIDRHHALMVVNAAKTVVTFLFNTYEYQIERGTLDII